MPNIIITTKEGVHVNLNDLIEFNKDLVKFKNASTGFLTKINSSVNTAERDWQDEKFVEFKAEFDKYTKILLPLAEELESYKKFSEEHWIPLIKEYLAAKRKK